MLPRSDVIVRLLCFWFLLLSVLVFAADTRGETRKIVHQVAPFYPVLAKSTRTSGAVKLNVTVDRNGTPKAIEVVGGNPVLVKAAQESVNKWKWAPAAMDTNERVELRFQPD